MSLLSSRSFTSLACVAALGLGLGVPLQAQQAPAAASAPAGPQADAPGQESASSEPSQAERLLLMSDQLSGLKPPMTLKYSFRKTGALEPAFEDHVDVKLHKQADGACCSASSEFLTGERKLALPELEQARGNPVILYFLEHDIRDMNRRTKGATAYFRKRIRMALFQSATVRDVQLQYRGKAVAGQEISIRPYQDDPNRARFEKFSGKQYLFVLSQSVPGGVASIRSMASEPGAATPFIDEELLLDGAEAPRSATKL